MFIVCGGDDDDAGGGATSCTVLHYGAWNSNSDMYPALLVIGEVCYASKRYLHIGNISLRTTI